MLYLSRKRLDREPIFTWLLERRQHKTKCRYSPCRKDNLNRLSRPYHHAKFTQEYIRLNPLGRSQTPCVDSAQRNCSVAPKRFRHIYDNVDLQTVKSRGAEKAGPVATPGKDTIENEIATGSQLWACCDEHTVSQLTPPERLDSVRIAYDINSRSWIAHPFKPFCPETRGKDEHRKSDDRRILPNRTRRDTDRNAGLRIPQKWTLALPVPHLPGSYNVQSPCPHYTSSLVFRL
jgi:hypothetical protein